MKWLCLAALLLAGCAGQHVVMQDGEGTTSTCLSTKMGFFDNEILWLGGLLSQAGCVVKARGAGFTTVLREY